jgi:hypothetical protein
MATLNDLPNELLLDIVKDLVPWNEREPRIGVNAAWSNLNPYFKSLKETPYITSGDSSDPPTLVSVSIYADLLAFRL